MPRTVLLLEEPTLDELRTAALTGHGGAWTALVRRLEPVSRQVAVRNGAYGADCDDAAAATMLKLYEHLGDIRNPEALMGWVATVTRREVIASGRRSRRQLLVVDLPERAAGFDDPIDRIEAEAVLERGRGAFARLSRFERKLLAFDVDNPGEGVKAAAEALDCPPGTVGPTRLRLRRKLRRSREFADWMVA